ncbi:MAG: hypothetical protein GWP59_06800 [Chlamydiales bacterium]|nr:hypothetical protein [Chlamydiales bacterium]
MVEFHNISTGDGQSGGEEWQNQSHKKTKTTKTSSGKSCRVGGLKPSRNKIAAGEELSSIAKTALKELKKPVPKKRSSIRVTKEENRKVINKVLSALANCFTFNQSTKIVPETELENPLLGGGEDNLHPDDGDGDTAALSDDSSFLGDDNFSGIEIAFDNPGGPEASGSIEQNKSTGLMSRAKLKEIADKAYSSCDEWKGEKGEAIIKVGYVISYARRCRWNSDFQGEDHVEARKYYPKAFELISRIEDQSERRELEELYYSYHLTYANMCYNKLGGEQDSSTAREHFKIGIERYEEMDSSTRKENITHFMIKYADMCYLNEGGGQDLISARKYYKLASENENIEGTKMYALMLYDGDGLTEEESAARNPREDRIQVARLLAPLDLEVVRNSKGQRVFTDKKGNELPDN